MTDQDEIAQIELVHKLCQVCGIQLIGVIRWVHPLAIAMPREIQGQHVKLGDEPRCKEIEPMRMRRAAVNAEDRRAAGRAVIQVVQPESADFDIVTGVGSWLEACFRTPDTLVYVVLAKVR